jgi:hypothetical protein
MPGVLRHRSALRCGDLTAVEPRPPQTTPLERVFPVFPEQGHPKTRVRRAGIDTASGVAAMHVLPWSGDFHQCSFIPETGRWEKK